MKSTSYAGRSERPTARFLPGHGGQVQWIACLLMLLISAACQKEISTIFPISKSQGKEPDNRGYGNHSPAAVLAWNQAAIESVNRTQQLVPNPPIPPFIESRMYAMVQIAMHDALNNIVPRYETYALHDARDKDADPDIAVAQAAHDVIVAMYGTLNPPAFVTPQPVKDYIEEVYAASMSKPVSAHAKARGIALGKSAAEAILANRQGDGTASSMYPVTEGTLPGQYRFTFPFNGPPFNTPPFAGFYDSPGWGNVKPFGMQTGNQFRPGPPDPVTSPAYTQDFNEIKRLGRYNSTDRTADQTTIAKFWAESSPQGWNRIALNILAQKPQSAWQTARLLALLQMAEADAYIGSLEAKIHYFYWRPVTAVRLADTDGNPDTQADPEWEVLGWNPAGPPDPRYWPTPPVADYPSAHATAGGAGSELMKLFFEKDKISFSTTSRTDPATRSFSSLSEAARENSLSRIYIGFHFRKACFEGENQGRNIGRWVFDHHLREK